MEPMKVGAIAPDMKLPVSGPKGTGVKATVGAGTYTSITNVFGPGEAGAGELVNITVRVKNTYTYGFYIALTGEFNGSGLTISPDYAGVDPGASYDFTTSFTMPSKDVDIEFWSWYWNGNDWLQDDYAIRRIHKVDKWIPLAETSMVLKRAAVGAWVQLASISLSLKRAPTGAWIPLTSTSLLVKVSTVGAWIPLASVSLSLKKAIVGGWIPLASASLLVRKAAVGGWVALSEVNRRLSVGASAGKDIFKSLAVDFEKNKPKELEETT